MQPVWVLSVDLQTKTATFQSGLSDAARSARKNFGDIKSGASEMGTGVGMSMTEGREGVRLLAEEFGVHLPRALTMFLAELGPVGAAMEAAFPFLAVAALAGILIEALVKIHTAGEQLTEDQIKFGTAAQNAYNTLEDKILQAQIKADELRNDHLGALAKQLELIDHESMSELAHAFEEVAKAADVVFKDLEAHWYTWGKGSDGAKHALDDFQAHYDSLLAQGKSDEASGLLSGTLAQAQRILQLQKEATANDGAGGGTGLDLSTGRAKAIIAENGLKAAGAGWDKKAVDAQEQLVEALTAQVGLEQLNATLKKQNSDNAQATTARTMSAAASAGAKEGAAHQLRMGEQAIAADRATANSRLAIQHASIAERLANDIEFSNREYQLQLTANGQQIAALDKLGKDYPQQLKALHDKALELTQAHDAQIAEMTARAATESAAKEVQDLQQAEREKLEATIQGSTARLAAIDAAIKEEQAHNLRDSQFFRELLQQRVETMRQMATDAGKAAEEAGNEAAAHEEKSQELSLASLRSHYALMNSMHRVSESQQIEQDTAAANADYDIKMRALQREEQALDKSSKDHEIKLKGIQDKEKELTQEHENQITEIKEKAEEERNRRILSAEDQFNSSIARGLSQVIMGHESFAKMMNQIGNQVVGGMIENAMKSMEANLIGKQSEAEKAARTAFNIGLSAGGPAGMILGPAFAALAFSAVTAFSVGGVVPGVGGGDIVPAMLTPGEGVIPGGVMDGLTKLAKSGGMSGAQHVTHVHVRPTYNLHALDAEGMDALLNKHSDTLEKHFTKTLRKMNR